MLQAVRVARGKEIIMEINSKIVGHKFRELKREVTWRQTTNYAAAASDANPCYLDDERSGGLVAPPLLATALTWPVTERLGDFIGIDDFPTEFLNYGVHYSEALEFHRIIRPGDRLVSRNQGEHGQNLFFVVLNADGDKALSQGWVCLAE